MSPTSLNRPIVENGCIYKSPFFVCVCGGWGSFSKILSSSVTLKMGSRSPKSNQFLSLSQQYSCTSLVKIHPFILEIGCRQAILQQSEPPVTLKMGSRSPKSNQFFSMSQQYRCTSLVKIHPSIHSGDRVHTSDFPTTSALL